MTTTTAEEYDDLQGRTNCPNCKCRFNPRLNLVTKLAAALAGAAGGAYIGSGLGIAAGPLGAIAGTVPGAIVGGSFALLGASRFTRCPKCKKVFKL